MNRKEYIRQYQREWMARRRNEWLETNGPCKACGSSENLEVDHIDPALKSRHPRDIWSRRKEVREEELAKCQVLCHDCHLLKTSADRLSKIQHGTDTMRRKFGCKCEECKEYVRRVKRESRARLKHN